MKKILARLFAGIIAVSIACSMPSTVKGQDVSLESLQLQIQNLLAIVAQLHEQLQAMQEGQATGLGSPSSSASAAPALAPTPTGNIDTIRESGFLWCHTFYTNLRFGGRGIETWLIQYALEREGFFIADQEQQGNNEFGESTRAAVIAFQEKYQSEILAPFGLQRGTGFVGEATKSMLNKLYGCPPGGGDNGPIRITGMDPLYGPVGTLVTINGFGFSQENNHIHLGRGVLSGIRSDDGVTLRFQVPSVINPECYYLKPSCGFELFTVPPLSYEVYAENERGRSNSRSFTVYAGQVPPATITPIPTMTLRPTPAPILISPTVTPVATATPTPLATWAPEITRVKMYPDADKVIIGEAAYLNYIVTNKDGHPLGGNINWDDGATHVFDCRDYGNSVGVTLWKEHAWNKAGKYTVNFSVRDCLAGGKAIESKLEVTVSAKVTSTPIPTPTLTPTLAPSPSATPWPTGTPTPTPIATATPTPKPSPTPTIIPSPSPTPVAGFTPVSVPILELKYFPLQISSSNLDGEITGTNESITTMRSRVSNLSNSTLAGMEEGTKYKGYKNSAAKPYLDFSIQESKEFLKAMPLSSTQVPWNPGIYRPDYVKMLTQDVNICDYVDNRGVKEVWIWGYHYRNIEPVESNMSMGTGIQAYWNYRTYGDVSNSERSDDLPKCASTYTMYNYNYTRGYENALHDHMHQLENLFGYADNALFWYNFVGKHFNEEPGQWVCGNTHFPPNATRDYHYTHGDFVTTKCEDWHPDGSGASRTFTCSAWGCTEAGFYAWWMQNLPGYENGISRNGTLLRNWWDLYADFDREIQKGKSLTASGIINPLIIEAPVDGQTLSYGDPNWYSFTAKPLSGATKYQYQFFQNGVLVTTKESSDGVLWLGPPDPEYSLLKMGEVTVEVRALVSGEWTAATSITIILGGLG